MAVGEPGSSTSFVLRIVHYDQTDADDCDPDFAVRNSDAIVQANGVGCDLPVNDGDDVSS